MKRKPLTPLSKAVTVQMRVFADLIRRWFDTNPYGSVAAARTRGVLVIAATGRKADRIEGDLLRAGLLEKVQVDVKP